MCQYSRLSNVQAGGLLGIFCLIGCSFVVGIHGFVEFKEEFVAEWEEGLEGENELDEANEEDAEDEVQFAGTKPATKPTSPSSPPIKVLKVQPAPKIPVPIIEDDKSKAAPRSIIDIDDAD